MIAFAVPVALEGFSSLFLFLSDTVDAAQVESSPLESREHDSEIGWVAKRSFAAPDWYGPGIALHTDSRGFRGKLAVDDAIPPHKQRVVCSGDSFTIGQGVRDDETWCAFLGGDLETVNMGQEAYGIDQAFLWYRREARLLQHNVHILAFITHDFARMRLTWFTGAWKPTLAVSGDSLLVTGVPVPRTTPQRKMERMRLAVASLRSSELTARLRDNAPREAVGATRLSPSETRAVFARIVAELARANSAKHSTLILLYLPVLPDYVNEASLEWREHVRTIADSLGVHFIDLIPELRKLTEEDARALYLGQPTLAEAEALRLGGAARHMSVEGNRWVATHVRQDLERLRVLRPAGVQETSR
jgi:hypothetical protein